MTKQEWLDKTLKGILESDRNNEDKVWMIKWAFDAYNTFKGRDK